MSELVDRLADLTAHRDRDVLDAALVAALSELLAPIVLAVHRCVGEAGAERWLTRARMAAGDVAPSTDGAWADLEQLPPLDARPTWRDCLRANTSLALDGVPATTLFPLLAESGAAGVLELCTAQALAPHEQRSVASILRLYRNFQGLLDYSERDTLTGLLNRKTFDDAFLKLTQPGAAPAPGAEAERRANAAGEAHYLGLIDIDHFKRVNDGFGHLIGDEVLLLLSRLMRGTFRYHDRLYRFGGEEFVVLMRCADDAGAVIAFERLRTHVAQYAFPQVGRITISVGYTAVNAHDTPSRAFERADRAVYFAKANGRDQVRSHAALVAAGLLDGEQQAGDVELF
jgi:diguanylate cyclase (GGDEF)-like protein